MDHNLKEFIFSTLAEAYDFMSPYLGDYSRFSESLSQEIRVKSSNNRQYRFDIELDEIFKKKLDQYGVTGKIFSEERGFYQMGETKYRVVYDPFCNSTLASRTFLDAAAGITIFSDEMELMAAAILDYQTGIVGIANATSVTFYQIQSQKELSFHPAEVKTLNESWSVIALEKPEERACLDQARGMLDRSKRIIINSGHIYWLRLAIGMIDVYLDPFGGEPLYEMFASVLVQKSGCIVTDRNGENFDPKKQLEIFWQDPKARYYPIAARNRDLHAEVMNNLTLK